MAQLRRQDTEEYQRAMKLAREIRATVADQVSALVLEGDQAGSGEKVNTRIQLVLGVQRDIQSARAVQERNREEGLPLAAAVRDEREAIEALRAAVMMVSVAAAEWVASMDFRARQRELSLTNGRASRRRPDEETI